MKVVTLVATVLFWVSTAHAQLAGVAGNQPVSVTDVTGGELSRFPINAPGTRIYTNGTETFSTDSIPAGFAGVKFISTDDSLRDSTGTDVVAFTLGKSSRVCVWMFDYQRANLPTWLGTDSFDLFNPLINVISTEFGDYTAYCKDDVNGAVSLDGNTTDGDTAYPMYLVSISDGWQRSAGVTIADAGEYQFVTSTNTVTESTNTNSVACAERVNGNSGAASVDVIEAAGSTCTTECTFTDPTTMSWDDGVDGVGGCVDLDAGAVSSDLTLNFQFDNESGITASGIRQTSQTTIANAGAVRAFPGAEGFAAEMAAGRGNGSNSTVCIVTNTNNSGAGSLRNCMEMTSPRFVIFRTSGTIQLQSRFTMTTANSYITVYGQTAPGDGIAIRAQPDGNAAIMVLSFLDGSETFHDGLFQHLRFRHGMPVAAVSGQADNLEIRGGTYNVIFDHVSFTWAGDETISFWRGPVHDVTFSHTLFAEGTVFSREGTNGSLGQNAGPILSGGSPMYNITFHHNAFIHTYIRNVRMDASNGGGTKGSQFINNVHYNISGQNYRFNQYDPYTGTANSITADVIADYFKSGPDNNPGRPVTLRAEAVASYQPMSLHLVNSCWYDINGDPHADNNEADNYEVGTMLVLQAGSQTPTYSERATPISPQPTFPVTTTSCAQAYIDVVVNEDVGATLPALDSVDQRIIDDPEDGGAWSSTNVPGPFGSGSYPTLSTSGVPTDTDGDGVPDAFESGTLGTDPNVAENHAVLDHDADGYKNIQEWVFTCDPAPCAN